MSSGGGDVGEFARFIAVIKSFAENGFPVNAGQESLMQSFLRTLHVTFDLQYDYVGDLENPFAVMTSVDANANINYMDTGHDEVIQDWIDDIYLVVKDLEDQINDIETPTFLIYGLIEIILVFWRTLSDI
jgi:RNAse (barnase) inhibitor barstar